MRKIRTLKKNYEFKNVLSKGKFYIGEQITIYITENKNDCHNVIGIAVSTKACNAVNRNKIKRLIRANYQIVKDNLKTSYNIVFLWNRKTSVENADFHIIQKDMKYLLKKAKLL